MLSGVNRGRNVGEDVIYSGTVAGAMEGAVLGIPSIALSQSYKSRSGQPPYWDTEPALSRRTSSAACSPRACARDVLININFPDCRPEEVKGIAVTPLGRRRQERLHIDKRMDGRGNPYYWIAYSRAGRDQGRARHRYRRARRPCVAVTPLQDRHHRRADHDAARRAFREEQFSRAALAQRGVERLRQRLDLERLLQRRAVADRLPARRAGRSRWRTQTARRAATSTSTTGVIGWPLRLTSRRATSNSACFGQRQALPRCCRLPPRRYGRGRSACLRAACGSSARPRPRGRVSGRPFRSAHDLAHRDTWRRSACHFATAVLPHQRWAPIVRFHPRPNPTLTGPAAVTQPAAISV